MKRTLLIAALFLGFSATGFSQTEMKTGKIVERKLVSESDCATESYTRDGEFHFDNQGYVFKVRDEKTGEIFMSLPEQAQIPVGERVTFSAELPGTLVQSGCVALLVGFQD